MWRLAATWHLRCVGRALYHTEQGVFGCGQTGRSRRAHYDLEPAIAEKRAAHPNLHRLITAYREHGHRQADLDPLSLGTLHTSTFVPELKLSNYGLVSGQPLSGDLHGLLAAAATSAGETLTSVDDLVSWLRRTYCGHLAAEFCHAATLEEREWFADFFETVQHRVVPTDTRVELAKLMLRCQAFDHFLAAKFATTKRYGGEGAESMMAVFLETFRSAAQENIQDVIMCMPHRGRNNVLTCLLKFPPALMLRKIKGLREFPPDVRGSGDVLSHLSTSVDLSFGGKSVHVTMVPNPSHLEANNPVAVGKTRGRLQTRRDATYYSDASSAGVPGDRALCLQVHGDASFAAQGIVAETFVIAGLPNYSIGGSVHLIVNNQIGFTTEAERARSSAYSSCLAKMNAVPVLHVNGDSPEAVWRAAQVALAYRQRFRKDVLIDLICYRRWGHNELDEPALTQPLMYERIRSRTASFVDAYAQHLVSTGVCTADDLKSDTAQWWSELQDAYSVADSHVPKANHLEGHWAGLVQAPQAVSVWDTGSPIDVLKYVGCKSVEVPPDFVVHPSLAKSHIQKRVQKLEEGKDLDWASAEALAIGSLLHQGHNVRISGQDVGRGTFSHRHAMLVDQQTDAVRIPLNHMSPDQHAFLEVANSALSEEAVLGFEYGMSIENPRSLIIWEAQFGDFFNGAQIIIDTYLTSGETKWLLQSGLVMLLPTGMDGAGPEHSSCRIERFLQLTDSKERGVDGDDVNMSVVHPTTPAQYFHLLRRQMVRNFRKPLIIASPKVLLRLPEATSTLTDMAPGTYFKPVLDDPTASPSNVKRVLLCFGKHYYTLQQHRVSNGIKDVAIVRIEEVCPFPVKSIQDVLRTFPNAQKFVWCQEEHENAGAWAFVKPRFEYQLGIKLTYAGRGPLACPAVGIGEVHKSECSDILKQAFN